MQGKRVIIRSNQNSVYDLVAVLLIGLFFATLGVLVSIRDLGFGSLIIFLSIRWTLYPMLDLFFRKTLWCEEGRVVMKVFGLRFRLDSKHSFINIDRMFVPVSSYAQPVTLNIYRNPKNFGRRLLKNKIKLNVVDKNNIEKMKEEARAISDAFGIRFIDDFEFE